MNKPSKGKQQDSFVNDPAYWRIRADILAIQDMLGVAYIESNAHALGQKLDPKSKEYAEMREDFKRRFKKLSAFHHGQLLTALEDISPAGAAQLDNREPGEIDTH